MSSYLLAAAFTFIFTVILALLALKFFPKLGLMDRPRKYGLKRAPIPYSGGLVMIVAFFVAVLIFVPIDGRVLSVLIGALLVGGMSFCDDRWGLSPFLRLGIQVLAAVILVLGGVGIDSVTNPLGPAIVFDQFQFQLTLGDWIVKISLLSALFTIIWVVAVINTMNFLDGLNGLPSGITSIAALALFLLSMRPHFHAVDQTVFATLSVILFATTFAFWFFDFYPAKMLMGDTGSMFLGFMLATLAIFSGGKVATAFLVMGVPILDAGWVIMRRILSGKSPFQGDLKHLHHRFLDAGLSERKALLILYFFCALFGFIAVFLETSQKFWAIVTLFLVMVVVAVVVVRYSQKYEQ